MCVQILKGCPRLFLVALSVVFPVVIPMVAQGEEIRVSNREQLARALQVAQAGTTILIAPGQYEGGFHVRNLQGTASAPIVIAGEDTNNPPTILGGSNAFQISSARHLELRNFIVSGSTQNGLNLDDSGSPQTPAQDIVLRNLTVRNVGPEGNRDGIKVSGLQRFRIENCAVESWGSGGSAIDMVGCREGVIINCHFRDARGEQANGVQAKGGTRDVAIQRCLFDRAGGRGVNVGGSTGLPYFRPEVQGFEAKDILVEDCEFREGGAAVAFVGVDGAIVRHNLILYPQRWVARILQESVGPPFVPCRKGEFSNNVIVFSTDTLRSVLNIGGNTDAPSFRFARNVWYCVDRPQETRRLVQLPSPEMEGSYTRNPIVTGSDERQPRIRRDLPHGADIRDRQKES